MVDKGRPDLKRRPAPRSPKRSASAQNRHFQWLAVNLLPLAVVVINVATDLDHYPNVGMQIL